jgi:hypothetical protein
VVNKGFYTPGGVVPPDGIYITRKADEVLLNLCKEGRFAYVLTSRQLGKTSLRTRIVQKLDSKGIIALDIDLLKIGTPDNDNKWYFGLLTIIEDSLKTKGIYLKTGAEAYWQRNVHLGATQRFTGFFQQILLKQVEAQIVILIDEIDTTLNMAYRSDFFAAIRYFSEARSNHIDFRRLSFVLIGVATPTELIGDPKRTPFNIGERVDLSDFTLHEALPLADGLDIPLDHAREVLAWVISWTGGHPYLTQRLCIELAEQETEHYTQDKVNQAVHNVFLEKGEYRDSNLSWVEEYLLDKAPNGQIKKVLEIYKAILLEEQQIYDDSQSQVKAHLKLSGLVKREGKLLKIRNPIYKQVFDHDWIKENLPQKKTFSLSFVIAISGIFSVIVIGLVYFAFHYEQYFPPYCATLEIEHINLLTPSGLTREMKKDDIYYFVASDAGDEAILTIVYSQIPANCRPALSTIWTVPAREKPLLSSDESAIMITYMIPKAGEKELFHVILKDQNTNWISSISFTLGTENK